MSHPRQGGVRRKTHASFFSGVGGMDIGLERAGWQTVSFSEIEPYPCAVLAERWPDVPNLGDITRIVDVPDATLWTGGFPCQDLSVAGQRKGFTGERSVLAFTFLDLVERHRPEAFILENVPGLLSSNAGRDFGRLLREVGDLGYGWAYRVLDAQWFGVPQRRRRVFILALDLDRHPDPDSAAEVLAIGTSCPRDHQEERASWSASAGRVGRGASVAGTYTAGAHPGSYNGQDAYTNHLVYGPPPDAAGVRAPDGMAGRNLVVGAIAPGAKGWRGMRGDGADPIVVDRTCSGCGHRWAVHDWTGCQWQTPDPWGTVDDCHCLVGPSPYSGGVRTADGMAGRVDDLPRMVGPDGTEVAATLRGFGHGWQGQHHSTNAVYVKGKRAMKSEDFETWRDDHVPPTLNGFDVGDTRATTLVADTGAVTSLSKSFGAGGPDAAHAQAGWIIAGTSGPEDDLLPLGLDSNRYRAIGNGVASPVAEWIGRRLADYLDVR